MSVKTLFSPPFRIDFILDSSFLIYLSAKTCLETLFFRRVYSSWFWGRRNVLYPDFRSKLFCIFQQQYVYCKMFPFLPLDIFEALRWRFPSLQYFTVFTVTLDCLHSFLQCMRDLGFDPVTTNTAMSHHISSNTVSYHIHLYSFFTTPQ